MIRQMRDLENELIYPIGDRTNGVHHLLHPFIKNLCTADVGAGRCTRMLIVSFYHCRFLVAVVTPAAVTIINRIYYFAEGNGLSSVSSNPDRKTLIDIDDEPFIEQVELS